MRKFILIVIVTVIVFIIWICRAFADPLAWDGWEKGLLASIVAANAIDCFQTDYLSIRHPDKYCEVDPYMRAVFGKHVHWYEAAALKTVIYGPLIYYGAYKWAGNHRIRKILLIGLLLVSIGPVINNERVGGGVLFNF